MGCEKCGGSHELAKSSGELLAALDRPSEFLERARRASQAPRRPAVMPLTTAEHVTAEPVSKQGMLAADTTPPILRSMFHEGLMFPPGGVSPPTVGRTPMEFSPMPYETSRVIGDQALSRGMFFLGDVPIPEMGGRTLAQLGLVAGMQIIPSATAQEKEMCCEATDIKIAWTSARDFKNKPHDVEFPAGIFKFGTNLSVEFQTTWREGKGGPCTIEWWERSSKPMEGHEKANEWKNRLADEKYKKGLFNQPDMSGFNNPPKDLKTPPKPRTAKDHPGHPRGEKAKRETWFLEIAVHLISGCIEGGHIWKFFTMDLNMGDNGLGDPGQSGGMKEGGINSPPPPGLKKIWPEMKGWSSKTGPID